MKLKFIPIVALFLGFQLVFSAIPQLDPEPRQINAVRFDPSYYYDSELEIKDMAEKLVAQWAGAGFNTIYYKAYDPAYGAKYKTRYPLNIEADYGKQDLLRYILIAAQNHHVSVVAWIPAFLHKNAWEEHPEWRIKNADQSDYQPTPDSYFLCPANDQVRAWWLGFIKDLLDHYPDLAGVDIAEPIIKWNGHQCFCESCRQANDNLYSVRGLTTTLEQAVDLIKGDQKIASITSVMSANENGRVLTPKEQILKSGFDLQNLLDAPHPPDWINLELMWQQWADLYQDTETFNPDWLNDAAREAVRQVDGRATLIGHLEQTSFGNVPVDAGALARAIRAAKDAGIEHIDIYDTHLLDEQDAWDTIQPELEYVKTKKVLVLTDPRGENDAKQIASLLGHFKTNVSFMQLDDESVSLNTPESLDYIFYIGVDPQFEIPNPVLNELEHFPGDICWINYGLDLFLKFNGRDRFGLQMDGMMHDSLYQTVHYKGYTLPRVDPSYVHITVTDSSRCRTVVKMSGESNDLPYVVKSGNLWYIADLPTAFVVEGGRHIVISDLLHDILHEDHVPKKIAMVRIEDVHPLTDVESLSQVIKYLKSQHVLFSIGVVPFYLDPESNVTSTMQDNPKFVELLHEAQRSGGSIVMHGSTHQFRGESTADYEFWDGMTEEMLFSDSKEYVRQKLNSGLRAFQENGIYPITWETPHYAASQMDYGVINSFFSSAYERRQTVNLHGSDQLLPYLIYNHTAGGKVLPENLGYIPLEDPNPAPMLRAAENNLAVRDGVASFFFHTFVDHKALKTIIPALKKDGYIFTSPRYTENHVTAPGYQAFTGSGHLRMSLEDQYYHEFYLDDHGKKQQEVYSDSLQTTTIDKDISVPQGWLFIAEKLDEKPVGAFKNFVQTISPSVPKLTQTIFKSNQKSLMDINAIPIRAAVLVDSSAGSGKALSQFNLVRSLSVVGIDARVYDTKNLIEVPENINLLVISQAAGEQLTEQQILFITYALQHGLNIVLEGHTALSGNIGIIPRDEKMVIHNVVDEYYPGVGMQWKKPDTLQTFDIDIDYVSYYSTQDSEEPVVVGGEYGNGKYLFFGTLFDPHTEYGYGRYPYFIDLLQRQFNLAPTIRRNNVEIYFEPGDREDVSIEDLIKIWRNNGVRRIYVSTWHFYEQYTYDYKRLIDLAHENAMLVYAWLEIPHVSEKFWNQHPQWREKTATGADARIDWRSNMAVDMPECRQAIFDELSHALLDYQWDGINFAELYYESPKGYEQPQNLTPMNDYIRNLYKQEYGYDPKQIFSTASPYYWKRNAQAANDFDRFREDRIYFLHGEFLKFMYDLKEQNNREWEILITTLDNIFSPDIGKATATNTRRMVKWLDQYPFTLQVEDPQPLWALGPERYTKILDAYSKLANIDQLILDINVVPWRNKEITQSPTAQPTGLELYQLARSAMANNTRVAIYSEASLFEVDFPVLTYVLAGDAIETIRDDYWQVNTPCMVNALLDADAHHDILLDGAIWPAYYNGRIIIPAGNHEIQSISNVNSFVKKFKSDVRLVDISGELVRAESISRGMKVQYRSRVPNIIVLSQAPIQVLLDDKQIENESLKGELGYSLRLPAGEHQVTFYTQTGSTQTTKYASVFISGLIVVLGAFAGVYLTSLYIQNAWRRKRAS